MATSPSDLPFKQTLLFVCADLYVIWNTLVDDGQMQHAARVDAVLTRIEEAHPGIASRLATDDEA